MSAEVKQSWFIHLLHEFFCRVGNDCKTEAGGPGGRLRWGKYRCGEGTQAGAGEAEEEELVSVRFPGFAIVSRGQHRLEEGQLPVWSESFPERSDGQCC